MKTKGRRHSLAGEKEVSRLGATGTVAVSQFQERKEQTCILVNVYFQLQEPSSIC